MGPNEKIAVLTSLVEKYQQLKSNAEQQQADAQREANAHIGAMISRYDTFKEEAQYLAQAQQIRALELGGGIGKIRHLIEQLKSSQELRATRAGLGSVVLIETEKGSSFQFFITPYGGGENVVVGDIECRVITPEAPIGRAIIHNSPNEEFDYPVGDKTVIAWIKSLL